MTSPTVRAPTAIGACSRASCSRGSLSVPRPLVRFLRPAGCEIAKLKISPSSGEEPSCYGSPRIRACESVPKWDPISDGPNTLISLKTFVRGGVPIGADQNPGSQLVSSTDSKRRSVFRGTVSKLGVGPISLVAAYPVNGRIPDLHLFRTADPTRHPQTLRQSSPYPSSSLLFDPSAPTPRDGTINPLPASPPIFPNQRSPLEALPPAQLKTRNQL
ncbi:MAG: hypothetical protein QOF70_4435 [Acetobacteraceae bacterium]|nr:hypothetical protein [Acetobacteraceae bacterium]